MIDPALMGWFWGFLPGPREWVVLVVVVVALYGRSAVARRGFARVVRPWTTRPVGATGRPQQPAWLADRWFLIVATVASAAVAAWVVTWMIVVHRPLP